MDEKNGSGDGEIRSIGGLLSAARRRKGDSVEDVERATKIRARFLRALEDDDFAAIPGDVYARGFIKSYAKYLGLDPEPLIQQYKKEYDHPIKLDIRRQAKPLEERKTGWSRRFAMTIAVVVSLLALLYWGATASKQTAEKEMRSHNEVDPKAPAMRQKSSSTASPTTTAKPSGVNISATATADEGCWLSVVADGQQVFEGTLQKGQTQEFRAAKSLTLYIGNAGGISIKRDGKDVGPLGQKGAVVQKTFTLEGN